MKKKLMTGLAVGFLVFGMVWSSGAATIVLHSTGQLGGIDEVEIAGSLWDATFYNQWTLSSQNTYSYDFSEAASIALYNLFNTTEFALYDNDPQMTWGIEHQGGNVGYLITPYIYGSNIMYGFAFVNKVDLYGYDTYVNIRGYTIQNWPNDQDNTHSYVQWTESVPIPSTVILLGIGLLGLAGVRRGKK